MQSHQQTDDSEAQEEGADSNQYHHLESDNGSDDSKEQEGLDQSLETVRFILGSPDEYLSVNAALHRNTTHLTVIAPLGDRITIRRSPDFFINQNQKQKQKKKRRPKGYFSVPSSPSKEDYTQQPVSPPFFRLDEYKSDNIQYETTLSINTARDTQATRTTIAHNKLSKRRLVFSGVINGTYFIQGLMALPAILDNKKTSALATEGFAQIIEPYYYAPPVILAISAYSINVLIFYDYGPKLLKKLKTIATEKTSAKKKGAEILLLLPSTGAAIASAELGYRAFEWIPTDLLWSALNPIASYGNCGVSFITTLATRFVGALNMVKRFEDARNPHRQCQNALTKALKQVPRSKLKELQNTINDLRNQYSDDNQFIYQFLQHKTVKEALKEYLPKKCSDHASTAVGWTAGFFTSLAGGVAFSQKFSDGITKIFSSFADIPYAARLSFSIIAGLPTNFLYLVHTLDGVPLMWDSMTKRARKKLASAMLFATAILSCASMLYVGTTVSNTKDGLYSDIIPPASDQNWYDYIYPLMLLLGPLSVNGKSAFNVLVRNPNMAEPTADDIIFWLEQNELSNEHIDQLAPLYIKYFPTQMQNPVKNTAKPSSAPSSVFFPSASSPNKDLEAQLLASPGEDAKEVRRSCCSRVLSRLGFGE
jgi:hypothetical protein